MREASRCARSTASEMRPAISSTGNPSPARHSTTNGVRTNGGVQSAWGQSCTSTTGTRAASAALTSAVVLEARLAGDDADDGLRIRDALALADDHRAVLRTGAELTGELLGEHAAHDEAADGSLSLRLSGDGAPQAPPLEDTGAYLGAALTASGRPASRPRAWMLCSTPIISRFATIDEPPTVTNGSGIPVTGATPIVMPDVDEDLEEEAEHEPAGDDRAVQVPGHGQHPQAPPDDEEVEEEQDRAADESALLRERREREVGRVLGEVVETRLARLDDAPAREPARTRRR